MSAPEVEALQNNGWVRVGGIWHNPLGLIQEPNPYQLAPYRPEHLSQRPLQPCGTTAAYRRHARLGEVCAKCEGIKKRRVVHIL